MNSLDDSRSQFQLRCRTNRYFWLYILALYNKGQLKYMYEYDKWRTNSLEKKFNNRNIAQLMFTNKNLLMYS